MAQLGLGVLINNLFGSNESTVNAIKESLNKKITDLKLDKEKNKFVITFEGGDVLTLRDDGQSCCESRYMTCDDDLPYFIGAKFLSIDEKDGGEFEHEYDTHEIRFIEIKTDKGSFQLVNHNEHNGYYGGFYLTAKLKKAD